jgi:hypothetical protein
MTDGVKLSQYKNLTVDALTGKVLSYIKTLRPLLITWRSVWSEISSSVSYTSLVLFLSSTDDSSTLRPEQATETCVKKTEHDQPIKLLNVLFLQGTVKSMVKGELNFGAHTVYTGRSPTLHSLQLDLLLILHMYMSCIVLKPITINS